MLKKSSNTSNFKFNISYSPDNQILAKRNQELLQKSIRLQESLNNYQQNYKMISYKLLLMSAELQSFKVGANIFAKQYDELKLNFYYLWYQHCALQKQHDYLKDRCIGEALRKNNKYSITTPSSFRSFTFSFTSTSTSGYNLESPKLPSQSSNQSFTPGYNSDALGSMNQSPIQEQNIKGSERDTSITDSLLRTKQWLKLVSS